MLGGPRCGGRLRLITLIEQATVLERILRHLGLTAEVPDPRAARAPPLPFGTRPPSLDDDLAPVRSGLVTAAPRAAMPEVCLFEIAP